MKKIFALLLTLAVSAIGQKLPTWKEVSEAGKKPYPRYSIAAGNLKTCEPTFTQPAFSTPQGKAWAEGLLRGPAEDLDLAGQEVCNEFGVVGVAVKLEKTAIVVYEMGKDGKARPLYLKDCTFNGKPYFNRLKLVNEPAPKPTPQVVAQAQIAQTPPPPQIVRQEIERQVPVPVLPSNMNVNVSGFPQPPVYPSYPANTTQRFIYEKIECGGNIFNNIKCLGDAAMRTGIGVGAAGFGLQFPKAYENAAYANRDGMIGAARARVPDVMNISASANPTQSQTGPTVSSQSNPVNTLNPVITAEGGKGGNGGNGGNGGTGGTGGSPSALATATGGPAGNTGPIKIDINNDNNNLNNNNNDNKNNNGVDVKVDVDVENKGGSNGGGNPGGSKPPKGCSDKTICPPGGPGNGGGNGDKPEKVDGPDKNKGKGNG